MFARAHAFFRVETSRARTNPFGMRTTAVDAAGQEAEPPQACAVSRPASVQEVYEAQFEFVWRSARRLGMRSPQLEDVVQEVFMVVQRRLSEFEGRSTLRTWLFAITRHVVRAQLRQNARRNAQLRAHDVTREHADPRARCPEAEASVQEDAQLLHELLDQLAPDLREVFVLAQLEELSGPEIAQALELPVRSVYSRIAAAQKEFDKALSRARAKDRVRP